MENEYFQLVGIGCEESHNITTLQIVIFLFMIHLDKPTLVEFEIESINFRRGAARIKIFSRE